MSTITEITAGLQRDIDQLNRQEEADRREIRAILADAEARGYSALDRNSDMRAEALLKSAEKARAARARRDRGA